MVVPDLISLSELKGRRHRLPSPKLVEHSYQNSAKPFVAWRLTFPLRAFRGALTLLQKTLSVRQNGVQAQLPMVKSPGVLSSQLLTIIQVISGCRMPSTSSRRCMYIFL
jgi:hypothetical protein